GARFDHFLDGLDAVPAAIARWTARRADAVVVLSEEWREQLSDRLPGARLHVVQNGIAAPALPGERRQNPETVVAFLGNLGRRKGVPELLQALARSPSRIRLRMAGGEEDPDFNRTARDMARHLGIENRVDFVGPISGPTKTAFLATADVFALPSHAEGLPMSLLEAMASGLPVIVTTVGAIPSVVRDQVDGLLVAPGDIDAIAAAMTRLAAAPEMRARMGTSARERCIAGFGLDRTVEKLTAVYDAVTQPRLPGSAAKSAGRA
ncbi:MAG: glycosyltransferase family 4 protein, partial [Burkholderiales bacterium]|nr:glycosyltransferase family 4 protein [Burkholderiales bacterium]